MESTAPRVIKKYQNRKLYDTRASCYVTLDDIAKMIKNGEEVTVVDNRTKLDVTAIILTQILYDQEKHKKSILPLTMLKNIIQSGSGSIFEFMQKYVVTSLNSVSNTKLDVERYVDRLVNKGELTKGEGKSLLKELSDSAQKGLTELQLRIDERIKTSISRVTPLADLQNNLTALHKKVEGLEEKLVHLE